MHFFPLAMWSGARRRKNKTPDKPPTADTSARAAARDIWGCASAGKSENHVRWRESHFPPFRTSAGANSVRRESAQNGRTRTGSTRGRGSPFKSLLGAHSEDFHAITLGERGKLPASRPGRSPRVRGGRCSQPENITPAHGRRIPPPTPDSAARAGRTRTAANPLPANRAKIAPDAPGMFGGDNPPQFSLASRLPPKFAEFGRI